MNILSCGVDALHTGAWAYSNKLWEIVSIDWLRMSMNVQYVYNITSYFA